MRLSEERYQTAKALKMAGNVQDRTEIQLSTDTLLNVSGTFWEHIHSLVVKLLCPAPVLLAVCILHCHLLISVQEKTLSVCQHLMEILFRHAVERHAVHSMAMLLHYHQKWQAMMSNQPWI